MNGSQREKRDAIDVRTKYVPAIYNTHRAFPLLHPGLVPEHPIRLVAVLVAPVVRLANEVVRGSRGLAAEPLLTGVGASVNVWRTLDVRDGSGCGDGR